MDLAGSLRGLGTLPDGPGAAFLLAVGQEADEAQQLVAGLDELVQTGGLDAHFLQERNFFLLRGTGNVLLGLGADGDSLGVFLLGAGGNEREVRVLVQPAQQVVLADVAGVDDRFGGQQAQLLAGGLHGVVALVKVKAARGLAALKPGGQVGQPGSLGGSGLVAGLGSLLLAAQAVADDLEVGQDQLQVDGINVADGVNALGLVDVLDHMNDVVIVEAAHNMDDGVALADVAQKLVAETRALAGTLDQTCNVNKLNDGRRFLVGLPDLGQLVQPRIRHRHDAGVRLNRAEGVVGRLRVLGAGQRIEQGRLAHVGQTHDT